MSAGGYTANNNFNGNTLTYASGARSENDTFYATTGYAGSVTVAGGASISGAQITSNMTMNVATGASLDHIVIGTGGNVTSSGTAISSNTSNITFDPSVQNTNTINTGGSITGGNWTAVNIGGTTYYQSGSTSFTGPVFLTNANLTVTSGAVVDGMLQAQLGYPTITVQSGGILRNSTLNNGYVIVKDGGVMSGNYGNSAQVTISSGGKSINDTFYTTYAGNDTVTVLSGATISGASMSNTTLVVSSGASVIQPLNIGAGCAAIIYGTAEVCFLPGTLISTPTGEIAVENLNIGDEVLTLDPTTGASVARSITWVGKGRVIVNPSDHLDLSGYPVCVSKNAVSPGVPRRNTYITSEHCLYVDGYLVPVRMLVNGTSIRYDTTQTAYEYYHFVTAQHTVVWAEGMLSETYLDTGNSQSFSQHGKVARLHRPAETPSDSLFPLRTDRLFVEAAFRRIAAKHGLPDMLAYDCSLTTDHDVHLITPTGAILRPKRLQGANAVFAIPPGIKDVRLVSRVCRPYDTIGPFNDDRRELGILVSTITLFKSIGSVSLDAHLKDDKCDGWHLRETLNARWTNGYAKIALPNSDTEMLRILSVEIIAGGPYIIKENVTPTLRSAG